MSTWINIGTLAGGFGGALAATLALWQAFQPGPIDDADAVVDALNGIRDAIAAGSVDLAEPDVQIRIAEAAQPVAGLLARNLNALSPDDLLALGGIADAAPGETVELRHPDGTFARVTFQSWNSFAPHARISFGGETFPAGPGWQIETGSGPCIVSYIGPTRVEPPSARFQLTC